MEKIQVERLLDERMNRALSQMAGREQARRRARCYGYARWYQSDAVTIGSGRANAVKLPMDMKHVSGVDLKVSSGDGRVTYGGREPIWVEATCTISIECDTNNVRLHAGWFLNGKDEHGSHSDLQFARASSDHVPMTIVAQVFLRRGDYLEIWGYGDSSYDLTVEHATFSVKEI